MIVQTSCHRATRVSVSALTKNMDENQEEPHDVTVRLYIPGYQPYTLYDVFLLTGAINHEVDYSSRRY